MSADALIEGLPDLVVLIRRDGLVLECGGGHGVPGLRCRLDAAGKRIESLWPAPVAEFLKLLMRRSLALRTTAEARLEHDGIAYEARASARGPERALCIIRQASASSRDDSLEGSDERPRPQLDRRGFLRRCKESMAMAALRERPLAVAVIQLDGISDIAQIIATKVSEQIMSTAILRLPAKSDERDGKPWWYLGQLSESLLALVLESADREAIGECVAALSASLREPIAIGGAVRSGRPSFCGSPRRRALRRSCPGPSSVASRRISHRSPPLPTRTCGCPSERCAITCCTRILRPTSAASWRKGRCRPSGSSCA